MARAKRTPEQQAGELITLLAEHAATLIAAGVTSVAITPDGGLTATLARPAPPPPAPGKTPPAPRQSVDPLSDAATYPGGKVPGFTREGDQR